MAGTKIGGQKAAATNVKLYGEDFYKKIGSVGGKLGHTGGFYGDPVLAAKVGRLGGYKSSRKGIKTGQGKNYRPKPVIIPPKPTIISKVRRAFHV